MFTRWFYYSIFYRNFFNVGSQVDILCALAEKDKNMTGFLCYNLEAVQKKQLEGIFILKIT